MCENSHINLLSMVMPPLFPSAQDVRPPPPSFRVPGHGRAWACFVLIGAAVLAAALWAAGGIAREQAYAEAMAAARNAAALKVALLTAELDKQRSLPFVLAQDSEVRTALATGDPGRYGALNLKFEALSRDTGAAVIYLLDPRGVGVAASNWNQPTSFVGSDYAFRPYFQGAAHAGQAEYFALGNVSNHPGLYLSRQLEQGGRTLGVVVVKVEFDGVEAGWRRFPDPVFVTDEHGVVLLSSQDEWRFLVYGALPAAGRDALRASLQFGGAPLSPLPVQEAPAREGQVAASLPGQAAQWYVHVQEPVQGTPWQFHLLGATREAMARAAASARVAAALFVLCALFLAGVWLHRRHRAQDVVLAQAAARQELESRVAARTGELRAANDQLRAEMEDRRRAETELHKLQEELVQANKLAFLGQITAGVAHEINQPVAAIRSYADNSAAYLDRGNVERVRGNMASIAALTQRIGVITDELRTFSRKTSGASPGPVPVDAVVDGALTLVGAQMRRHGIELERLGIGDGLAVRAERVRLEQVLVNLLQNAIEALEQTPGPRIWIRAAHEADLVAIEVGDNGPGLPDSVMAALYTPFVTTKPRGLGLGLVISRDIVADFGGTLSVQTAPGRGTCFTIRLPEVAS